MKLSDIITLDFETFYSDDYTLRKLSTSEYIQSNLVKVHCVGVKDGTGVTKVYDGEKIEAALKAVDWPNKYLLCHNTAFDGFILTQHYGLKPKGYLDTLSMARCALPSARSHALGAVGEYLGLGSKLDGGAALVNTKNLFDLPKTVLKKLKQYCAHDVNLTYKIFKKLEEHYPDDELALINLTIRMFCEPVLELDIERLANLAEKEIGEKAELLRQAQVSKEDLLSNDKFIALIESHGVRAGMKISKTTGKMAYATAKTDAWMQELLAHPNPHVRALAEARIRVKSTINETRAGRLLRTGERSKLPFGISYCGTLTLRWSGANKTNLQNLERDGELRKSILPPHGHAIVKGDSSQIEARITAWLADQADLLEGFRNQEPGSPFDVYTKFGNQIYGTLITKKDKLERFVSKTAVLGLGFGMAEVRFQDTLAKGKPPVIMALDECKRIVKLYRHTNNMIVLLWKRMDRIIIDMVNGTEGSYKCISWGKGYIRLPNGTFIKYPEFQPDEGGGGFSYRNKRTREYIYGAKLLENVCQALARIVVAEQMLEVDKKYRVVGMEHDAIAVIAKKKDEERAKKYMLKCMKEPPSWALDLPISAEVKSAEHYL